MGIDTNGARFIIDCTQDNVALGTCAMLGRQEMHLTASQLAEVFRRRNISVPEQEAQVILSNGGDKGYSESFLIKCGATTVTSFDNSSYERATVVHDMNVDVPAEYHRRFDCVIDSGTLEHVFNIPVAIRNCMRMVKPGGHFLSIAPCNNFMGHGFYQFSPELFYGVLCQRNGFSLERMFIFESRPGAQWYQVADPKKIGGRVELINNKMTYILVQARRLSETEIDDVTPQQSDYVAMWTDMVPAAAKTEAQPNAFRAFKGKVKGKLREVLRLLPIESVRTPFRPPWYEPYE